MSTNSPEAVSTNRRGRKRGPNYGHPRPIWTVAPTESVVAQVDRLLAKSQFRLSRNSVVNRALELGLSVLAQKKS